MMYFGRDCVSLAVVIGTKLELNPILLQRTRRNDLMGLMSVLTKDLQGVVMSFLSQPDSYWSTIYEMKRNGDQRTEEEITNAIILHKYGSEGPEGWDSCQY
jgi:hypothetical protein